MVKPEKKKFAIEVGLMQVCYMSVNIKDLQNNQWLKFFVVPQFQTNVFWIMKYQLHIL